MIIPVQGLEIEQTRKRAAEDAERDDNVTHEATCFDSERVSAGVTCIYMLQEILQTGIYHANVLIT
jgi:hypothetical protein